MPDQLNVIALISGGKDSLYSLLHCIQHGHQVIALANLHPANLKDGAQEAEDINSFMYQTVGHSVIPLYAEALGIPLYCQPLTGVAVVTDKYYSYDNSSDASSDETENLTTLLEEILRSHPSANAISTGAIQSTYQRTRVESVALRLGLTPLGFLWQYPILPPPPSRSDSTTGLLEDMAASGCDARIIKIASGGIAERLLWTNVASTKTMQGLVKGLSMFFEDDELGLRGAVVGEGGEFESLAVSGPRCVWKNGRIEVDVNPAESWSEEGGASYVKLGNARLARYVHDKEAMAVQDTRDLVPVPALLDTQFEVISQTIPEQHNVPMQNLEHACHAANAMPPMDRSPKMADLSYTLSERTVQINNLTYNTILEIETEEAPVPLVEQIRAIVSYLPALLDRISTKISSPFPLTTSSIVHAIIVLQEIDSFTVVNKIYASMFKPGVPNPPARVTIAAPLPKNTEISLSLTVDLGPLIEKEGLHVQSRSYWAPANIGPYSQAISVPLSISTNQGGHVRPIRTVHVAGQIPLLPSSMKLSSNKFSEQAVLSLQHLWRLGQERIVDMWAFGVAYLGKEAEGVNSRPSLEDNILQRAPLLARIWRLAHLGTINHATIIESENDTASEDEVDIWHLRQNYSTRRAMPAKKRQLLHQLPMRSNRVGTILPPLLVAEVSSLPRHAAIEWWSLGIAELVSCTSAESHHVVKMETKNNALCSISTLTIHLDFETHSREVSYIAYLIKAVPSSDIERLYDEPALWTTLPELIEHTKNASQDARLVNGYALVKSSATKTWEKFSTSNRPMSQGERFTRPSHDNSKLGDSVTMIPCYEILGHTGCSISTIIEAGTSTLEPVIERLDVAFLLRLDSK